jgi:arabinogalactan endo-1,4-beta-galactosidase
MLNCLSPQLRSRSSRHFTGRVLRLLACLLPLFFTASVRATQPTEPTDIQPIDGEIYYFVNQLSGLQMDLNNSSTTVGDSILIESRSFTSLTQRWALTKASSGNWAISNLSNGLCLDSNSGQSAAVQNTCAPSTTTQQWTLTAASNGYSKLTNVGTGLLLDVSGSSSSVGATLSLTSASGSATQSQQWLLRPVFFRGVDNALLEKQEAVRALHGLPWWLDAGQSQDILQILKNHGVNMIRIRPTPLSIYETYTANSSTTLPAAAIPATCTGNGCYAETEAADLDLAKRAKQLGMAVELTLFFDGGSSKALPGAWSSYTTSTQLGQSVYNYVKSEIESYRSAGVMPDLVAIGNEVDTGLFSTLASPTGSDFTDFATVQKQGMQAVLDAAADTSIGSAIPAPLRCIHITPAWDLTNFFGYANTNAIPFDAICQSYYPFFHGPLTTSQTNTNSQPVEQTVLTKAANALGKPIFLIEVGEHYESGYDSTDSWYGATLAGQRQFLIDVNTVLKGLPDNLGMGFEYWDATGVNTASTSADGATDATYAWNGLTLFDNADTSGSSLSTATNYSATLSSLDALGGKMDSTLAYKLVNASTGDVLEVSTASGSSSATLDAKSTTGALNAHQQWTITSDGDGYLQIASSGADSTTLALDNSSSSTANSAVTVATASSSSSSQKWNLVTEGNGYYAIVNKASGLVLAESSSSNIEQQSPSSTSTDWITPADTTQKWQVIPVHITAASAATQLAFASGTPTTVAYDSAVGKIYVDLADSSGFLSTSSSASVTLTIAGADSSTSSYSQTYTATSSAGVASFDLSSLVLTTPGAYTLTASSTGLTNVTSNLTYSKPALTVAAQNAERAYGDANPSFTYTVTGYIGSDTASTAYTGTPVLSTTAATTSDSGTYSIAISCSTMSSSSYTFNCAAGTLTVDQAGTATQLKSSSSTAYAGASVTLTATVTSASATAPSGGTVDFYNGSTLLGNATLASANCSDDYCTATYSGSLSDGANSLTATFVANADFTTSTSTATTVTVADYSVTSNQSTLTIAKGGSGSATMTLTPTGNYSGTVTLSCQSTLSNVSCSFNPSSLTFSSSSTAAQTATATITASSSSAAVSNPNLRVGRLFAGVIGLPGMFLLWLGGRRSRKSAAWRRINWLIVLAIIGAGISACGGGGANTSSTSGGGSQTTTGTVTLTATSSTGSIVQTVKITLTED